MTDRALFHSGEEARGFADAVREDGGRVHRIRSATKRSGSFYGHPLHKVWTVTYSTEDALHETD